MGHNTNPLSAKSAAQGEKTGRPACVDKDIVWGKYVPNPRTGELVEISWSGDLACKGLIPRASLSC